MLGSQKLVEVLPVNVPQKGGGLLTLFCYDVKSNPHLVLGWAREGVGISIDKCITQLSNHCLHTTVLIHHVKHLLMKEFPSCQEKSSPYKSSWNQCSSRNTSQEGVSSAIMTIS